MPPMRAISLRLTSLALGKKDSPEPRSGLSLLRLLPTTTLTTTLATSAALFLTALLT